MKGMTGESDMRSVWDMIHNDEDPEAQQRARVAMDVYINRLLKYVGSYTAELGGLDVITFTAGIGENDAAVRRELAEALAPLRREDRRGGEQCSLRRAARHFRPRLDGDNLRLSDQ